jgi:hypothetical protein
MAKTAQKAAQQREGRSPAARPGFTLLEKILISKGVSKQQIVRLQGAGVHGKEDLKVIGDAGTLAEVAGLSAEVAQRVMSWALGEAAPAAKERVVVQPTDAVLCVHCGARQPKDHESGDLCVACGKQAEPVMACFWCGATGPGKFCRQCGAEFLPTAELELGILLKREGVPKSEVPEKLRRMDQADKDVLWGRARRY